MNPPIVSIIIPVYNSARYLAEAVQSALAQTWQHTEIIIVDDGSTDNSLQIANGFKSETVKVLTQNNNGASAARNRGLREAKGDYIQFLDADDLLSPDKITAQLNLLCESKTELAICKTVHFYDGEEHKNGIAGDNWFYKDSIDPVDFLTKLYAGEEILPGFGGMVTIHSWLTPHLLIEKAGPWNENLSLDDDGEFFCRVVLAADGIRFSENGFSYYRKHNHNASLSAQKNLKAMKSAVLANDLKLEYLKGRTKSNLIDRVFAKHYWWTGVLAYPQFKSLSIYCIKRANELGYDGEKYVGGPLGHFLAEFLGWKGARLLAHYLQLVKRSWTGYAG